MARKRDDLIPDQAFGRAENKATGQVKHVLHKWAHERTGAAMKCCICCWKLWHTQSHTEGVDKRLVKGSLWRRCWRLVAPSDWSTWPRHCVPDKGWVVSALSCMCLQGCACLCGMHMYERDTMWVGSLWPASPVFRLCEMSSGEQNTTQIFQRMASSMWASL